MANYYNQTSFVFDVGTAENVETLCLWLTHLEDSSWTAYDRDEAQQALPESLHRLLGNHLGLDFQRDPESPSCICITADDGEAMAQIMQAAMQTLPGVPEGQGFSVSEWCDKQRIGAFGGHAFWVTKDKIDFISTQQWLQEKSR